MNLIQLGRVILSSGAESDFKLECDQFIEENAEGLAWMVRQLVGPFSSVEGVPRGGLKLAEALRQLAVNTCNRHLIVDDVMTTGGSMERLKGTHSGQGPAGRPGIVGAVVFARGPCPPWIKAIFQMPEPFWLKKGRIPCLN